MRSVSTQETTSRISAAIDAALDDAFARDHRITNRYVAGRLGVHEAAVGRWRRGAEPTRDQLAELEHVIGKPLGHITRMAGYVAKDDRTAEQAVRDDPEFDDVWSDVILSVMAQARAAHAARKGADRIAKLAKRSRG